MNITINNQQAQSKEIISPGAKPTVSAGEFPTSYREVTVGKTLYRVTSVYKGEITLKDALEDLAVRRALRDALAETGSL